MRVGPTLVLGEKPCVFVQKYLSTRSDVSKKQDEKKRKKKNTAPFSEHAFVSHRGFGRKTVSENRPRVCVCVVLRVSTR